MFSVSFYRRELDFLFHLPSYVLHTYIIFLLGISQSGFKARMLFLRSECFSNLSWNISNLRFPFPLTLESHYVSFHSGSLRSYATHPLLTERPPSLYSLLVTLFIDCSPGSVTFPRQGTARCEPEEDLVFLCEREKRKGTKRRLVRGGALAEGERGA